MKFKSALITVADMERSKLFYKSVLGLRVVMDLGENVSLNGGITLQTVDSWKSMIDSKNILFGGKDAELYFEEKNFDAFIEHLKEFPEIKFVHQEKEQPWGQRVIRFYDPDLHIIEVGENIKEVCLGYLNQGMTIAEVAKIMDMPAKFVNSCKR